MMQHSKYSIWGKGLKIKYDSAVFLLCSLFLWSIHISRLIGIFKGIFNFVLKVSIAMTLFILM